MHHPFARRAARGPIVQFLSWATQQPDTWGITYLQYLQYLQAPSGTTVSAYSSHRPPDRVSPLPHGHVPTGRTPFPAALPPRLSADRECAGQPYVRPRLSYASKCSGWQAAHCRRRTAASER